MPKTESAEPVKPVLEEVIAQAAHWCGKAVDADLRIAELEAENTRMRSSLQWIVECRMGPFFDEFDALSACRESARMALEGGKP